MSLYYPPMISAQAERIREVLAEYAEPKGGTVEVMGNMRQLWEKIFMLNTPPRVLVVYGGEIARGGFNQANTLHRVDRQWTVVVLRGHGWNKALSVPGEQGEEPFYDVIEAVRDILRGMRDISEEFPIDYKSIKPLPSAGPNQAANVFMDAYVIEFSTANDLCDMLWEAPT